jgi:hypothetical protein
MTTLYVWLGSVGAFSLIVWLLIRQARSSGHYEADLDAEQAAREAEQAMADAQAQGQTTDRTLDKLDGGKF